MTNIKITQKIAIIAILLISFFGMNLQEGKGQCPTGYSTVARLLNFGGCFYNVNICYKCEPTINKQTIFVSGFTKIDPNCVGAFNDYQVKQQINAWLLDSVNIRTICLNILPCEEGALTVVLEEPVCWRYKKISGQLWLVYDEFTCGTALCYAEYEFCWDSNKQKYVKTLVYGPSLLGTPTCWDFYTTSFESLEYYKFLTDPNYTGSVCFFFVNNMCGYHP